MMGFGLIGPLVLIGIVAYALGWRPQIDQTGPAQRSDSALDILKERYVRGEINREEFDRIRRDLEG